MTVFLDTVGLLALWDQSDQWHGAARACYSELLATQADLVISNFVLLECGNAAARRPYRSAVNRLRKEMDSAKRLIVASSDDWEMAWRSYEKGEADGAGIVDHTSFAIMRRLRIVKAFTLICFRRLKKSGWRISSPAASNNYSDH